MKIVSRSSEEGIQFQRLRDIIEAATGGAIATGGEVEPADTLKELVTQVDIACASLMELADKLEQEIAVLNSDNSRLGMHITYLEDQLEIVQGEVEYDEDLDHATIDMMEALVASGASEPTFDGELSFQENIVISKEDFKPIVRETINSWLRLKVR